MDGNDAAELTTGNFYDKFCIIYSVIDLTFIRIKNFAIKFLK